MLSVSVRYENVLQIRDRSFRFGLMLTGEWEQCASAGRDAGRRSPADHRTGRAEARRTRSRRQLQLHLQQQVRTRQCA